jgi:hypothetical protein
MNIEEGEGCLLGLVALVKHNLPLQRHPFTSRLLG